MHIQANYPKDNVWLQRSAYIAAENEYREKLCKINGNYDTLSLAGEVAKARQQLKKGLENLDMIIDTKSSVIDTKLHNRLKNLEKVNGTLQKNIKSLEQRVQEMEQQIKNLTSLCGQLSMSSKEEKQSQKVDQKPKDDDDVDLFGSDSDSEDETAQKIREERLAAYNEKKSKKPTLVAKSNIIFDVKPWDDETDMVKLEAAVRSVTKEGLLWGAGKLVPLAYGIHKLQISCVIEDELVSVDWIQETIESGSSDFVQSVDIAAFNKI